MKRIVLSLLTTAAFAAEPAPMQADKPEALPRQPIAAIEVNPAKVVIGGIFESAQILITAKLATGETADVTRLASVKLSGEAAAISPHGAVTPLKNGTAKIDIEVAGKRASIPVEVRGVVELPKVDFIRDVNPVMTKAGCNAGTCHGAKDGKFGFKLSLRGYDPLYDVRALKDDLAGRRLNAAQPDDSLMLLKATAGVPHEGGQRFKVGDKYYNILRSWIADGAKLDTKVPRVTSIEVYPRNPVVLEIGALQQFRIVATYADGRMRDVTAEAFIESGNGDVAGVVPDANGLAMTLRRGEAPVLARYEGSYAATTLTVMGDRTGFVWKQPETWSRIDELVAAKWQRMKIAPSGLCTDEEFLRRAHLDLTGLPPGPEEVRAFIADTAPAQEKRSAVIDKLIGSPVFVDHWTNKWADLLQVNSKFLGGEGAKGFRDWIREQIEKNAPYDQFARAILTATGSNKENPAASYWKILRDPAETMENTTHLFLATRFNCNKCHDHPFERWTQDQYYTLGAYFSQVGFDRDPASGKAVIVGTAVEKAKPLWEIVKDTGAGEMIHLRTNQPAPPAFPYTARTDEKGTRREQLAGWLTSADNRYFASSYVNRLWGYLTGAGIIEPLDDTRAGNPPTNPELLDYLTREFIDSGFDVRHVLALIAKSRTYQLAISTNKWNEDDKTNYSHALARRLPAEVLYDAVLKVTGSGAKLPGGQRAQLLADGQTDLPSGFLANLGKPPRESACECERSNELRLGSVMALLGGPAVGDAIGDPKNEIVKLVASQPDDAKLVDELFMRVLNRAPGAGEVKKTLDAWASVERDHQHLTAARDAKESEQAPIIAKMEADRVAAIDAAKKELSRFEAEIAPKIAEAEKKRQADIAAADKAAKDYEKTKLAAAQTKFEQTVPVARTYTGWQLLDPATLTASNLGTLAKQPDGSIKAGPTLPKTTDYTVVADSKLEGITGFLLEVLPDAEAANFGPGRANGNFVLGEFSLKAGAVKGNPSEEIEFINAIADFSQEKFDVKGAIDGKKGDANNGWAVGRAEGVPHFAAFQLKKPLGNAKDGMRLRFELNQPRNPNFSIARFRLWATTSQQPLNVGLPLAVAEALKKPGQARTKDDNTALAAYWNGSDPDLRKLRLALGKNQLPQPVDPGVVERKAAVVKSELPVRLDPKLVQLRADVEQSKQQIANHRLTGAQDLVWALVNTPAFLFNR
ncbi:MAG: DUF1549 and DUF1553 domain-containing protein [Chthoniobacteraceae bacterium]